jgi:hypothetical protein
VKPARVGRIDDGRLSLKNIFTGVGWVNGLIANAAHSQVGLLYAAHFCQSEVCNGGFTQFFWE